MSIDAHDPGVLKLAELPATKYAHWNPCLQTIWVSEVDRVVVHESVQVNPVFGTKRIRTEPVANPRGVVPIAVVVQPGRIVALFTTVAIVFSRISLCLPATNEVPPEWEIFLVADDIATSVNFQ